MSALVLVSLQPWQSIPQHQHIVYKTVHTCWWLFSRRLDRLLFEQNRQTLECEKGQFCFLTSQNYDAIFLFYFHLRRQLSTWWRSLQCWSLFSWCLFKGIEKQKMSGFLFFFRLLEERFGLFRYVSWSLRGQQNIAAVNQLFDCYFSFHIITYF